MPTFILHDSAGAVYNVSKGTLRVLNNGYPPGTTPPGIANPANTWFSEFLTPVSQSIATPTPQPPQRSIFMSDRAVPSKWSEVPEFSDHYMCGPPNCLISVRMTEYNNNDGSAGGPDATCSTCNPTVATRGAWSPNGTQYLTMNQNILPGGTSTGELHLYTLNFPSAELGGQAKLSGQTKLK